MQCASVYEVKDELLVHPDCMAPAGYWIATGPYLRVSRAAPPEDLGLAVLSVLQQSQQVSSGFEAIGSERSESLRALGLRSESALQRQAQLVSVELVEGNVTVIPNRNGGVAGPGKGFHPLSSQRLLISFPGPAAVGTAVHTALELCRGAP